MRKAARSLSSMQSLCTPICVDCLYDDYWQHRFFIEDNEMICTADIGVPIFLALYGIAFSHRQYIKDNRASNKLMVFWLVKANSTEPHRWLVGTPTSLFNQASTLKQ